MASEVKYTPGPWRVAELDRRCVVGPDGDTVIADVRSWHDTDDACLIAAAPELLSALKRLKSDALAILRHQSVRAFDETLTEADAAIAKAEGKKREKTRAVWRKASSRYRRTPEGFKRSRE
jgi:hypothetical protein